MSTNRTFQDMLDDYIPDRVFIEEIVRRDYLLSNIERDDNWTGAGGTGGQSGTANSEYIVKFKGAGASSVSYGQLTADTDIAEDKYVRGRISAQKEVWGTMIFNHRDLMENKKISEQKFLDILPNSIEDFADYYKGVISVNLLNGAWFASLTANGDNQGNITVDRPDRFVINQKVIVVDANGLTATTAYVNTINMDTFVINLLTARPSVGGGVAVDFSAQLFVNSPRCYNDGAQTAGQPFLSLRGTLLAATHGGDTTLHSQTKTTYPYLQAINIDGTDVTATNIMTKVFDAVTRIRTFGKGAARNVLMSYKNYGSCIKAVEDKKGNFNVVPDSLETSEFGWDEITVGAVARGHLKLVGVQEMDNDIIIFLDFRALKFASNGFIQKVKSPDGLEYFIKRAQTGYQYIIDMCVFGELVLERPSYCGIMYGISY